MKLELKNIRMSYNNIHKEDRLLLDGINMTVEEGKVTALLGGNGVGKTTLFNIISGIEKGYQGMVLLDGKNISKWPDYRIARSGIGRLFQGKQLSEDLTLLENMKMASMDNIGERPWDFFRRKKIAVRERLDEERALLILKNTFGLSNKYLEKLDKKASELSYGEQRLLALVRLLMGDSELLLLDEPTSGVNPIYFETIFNIIRDMVDKKKKTVLLIEHNMDFVQRVADRWLVLADGALIDGENNKQILGASGIRKE